MLSWSLRRKSAPPPAVAESCTDPGSPSDKQSPSKSPRGRSRSLSSKGSLSSLFSGFKRDHSAKSMDPAEVVDCVEASHYPIFNPSNPDHLPSQSPQVSGTSPAYSGSTSPKSSLRRTGSKSSLQSKNILDTIAAKMKAATEFFHRPTSESQSSEDSRHSKSSFSRSPSPKKSVRFRSSTFSRESAATSSPIDVPTKTPCLPRLQLPSEDFLTTMANESARDPIPTGRPEDSPFLKDQRDSDYFFPFPTQIDSQLDDLRGKRGAAKPLPLIDLEKRASAEENPFSDAAAITEPSMPDHLATDPTDTSAVAPNTAQDLTPTASQANQSIEQEWSRFSPSKPPDETSRHAHVESESNVTNPFCASTETFGAPTNPPDPPPDYEAVATTEHHADQPHSGAPRCVWSLESRMVRGAVRSLQDEDDSYDESDSSDDTIAHLRRRPVPTHEDIRHQFRTRRSGGETAEWPRVGNTEDIGMVDATNSEPRGDPPKYSPDNISSPLQGDAPSQPEVVPDSAVSPLNLSSNVSSTSPSRARRPFRFSNKTSGDTSPAQIGTTRFSWEGHTLPSQVFGRTFEDKTPSPVAIPLPLSVALKHRGPAKWRDQHGWTPFDEEKFPEAILESPDVHNILGRPGGFAQGWIYLRLPDETGPEDDTKALTKFDIREMLRACSSICATRQPGSTQVVDDAEGNASMAGLSSYQRGHPDCPSPLVGPARHLSGEVSMTDDGSMVDEFSHLGRSPRKYSGEVSTINEASTAAGDDDTDVSCIHCKSNSSSCRCTDSTQTSTETRDSGVSMSESAPAEQGEVRQAITTPTRYPLKSSSISPLKAASVETTPRQSDFSSTQSRLPIRERSRATMDTSTTDTSTTESDEEKYIKGII